MEDGRFAKGLENTTTSLESPQSRIEREKRALAKKKYIWAENSEPQEAKKSCSYTYITYSYNPTVISPVLQIVMWYIYKE